MHFLESSLYIQTVWLLLKRTKILEEWEFNQNSTDQLAVPKSISVINILAVILLVVKVVLKQNLFDYLKLSNSESNFRFSFWIQKAECKKFISRWLYNYLPHSECKWNTYCNLKHPIIYYVFFGVSILDSVKVFWEG